MSNAQFILAVVFTVIVMFLLYRRTGTRKDEVLERAKDLYMESVSDENLMASRVKAMEDVNCFDKVLAEQLIKKAAEQLDYTDDDDYRYPYG